MGYRRFTQNRDPHWIDHCYRDAACARCHASITRGSRIFYYPNGATVYCAADACGGQASRDFNAAAADEKMLGS